MFSHIKEFFTRPSGYNLNRSVRLRSSASAYLNRTFGTPTNNKIWTMSFWVKRGSFPARCGVYSTTGVVDYIEFGGGVAQDDFEITFNNTTGGRLTTTQLFRDPSAWYHIIIAVDTTQATASNRVKIYVNGNQVTSFSTSSYPSQNYNTAINSSVAQYIGADYNLTAGQYFDGYLTEVNFIDGQALTPSSFGETDAVTGVWKPKKYTGTYGTNGFYLKFEDTSSFGKDSSGNSNTWTSNNISNTAGSTYDSMTDVPTLTSATVANYCVWNPVEANLMQSGSRTISNGNLTASDSTSSYGTFARGTIWASSGKYYWEINCTTIGSTFGNIGFCDVSQNGVFYQSNGSRNPTAYNTGTTSYGSSYTTGDVIGVALDLDNNQVTFYKNNTSQGAVSFSAGTYTPSVGDGASSSQYTFDLNCGQRPFSYTPPTGFVALNTFNLPASTIVKGNTVMDATLYTGTGASLSVTNTAGFKPDLVWIKSRSAATDHKLTDSVRGTTKALISDTTGAETTDTNGLTAFGTGGFTVGTDTTYNNNTATYVGWQWQAGQGSSSSNTNGSITSTVSVNATAGFSIVTYTGTGAAATVGHGLGVAAKMIIVKDRGSVSNWNVYHTSLGNTQAVLLNSTNAASTSAGYWNNTSPTSTVFSVGNGTSFTSSLAYCWSEVAGFSKFGSYTGNGSTDGPFVYCGFRPKFILVKSSSGAFDWHITDTSRSTYNQADTVLFPNSSAAETNGGGYYYDLLSNGFKCRNLGSATNGSGATYIFAAFAENPFKNALAR